MAIINNKWYIESFQLTYKAAADWEDSYVLPAGAVALESDTKKTKIGDGTTQWKDLAYYSDPVLKGLVDSLTERTGTLESKVTELENRIAVFEGITGISVNPAPAQSGE